MRFESLVESLSDIVFTLDEEGRHTAVYGRWIEDQGLSPETFLGRTAVEIFGPDRGRYHVEMAKTCIRENRSVSYEWSTGEGEHTQFFHTPLSPIREAKEPPKELVGIGRDISALKHTQLSLEKSLRDKATFLQEVHHRVKNNLQIIVSLLRLQSQHFQDEKVGTAFEDTMARVASMVNVHERRYQSSDLDSIRFDEYLEEIGRNVVDLYRTGNSRLEVDIRSEELYLDVATAIPFGLIATELVSSAAKHAFPDGETGVVVISFRSSGKDLVLRVCDNGQGLPEVFDPRASRGLGMALVLALCDQLGARCHFEGEKGTKVVVSAPIRA